MLGWTDDVAHRHVEIALAHPIKLIANALGIAAEGRHRPRPRAGREGRRARGQGSARGAARQQRGRRRHRAGLRGGRTHRRDRDDGARTGGGRRDRARTGARGGRHRHRPADRRRARRSARRACGSARCGSRPRRATRAPRCRRPTSRRRRPTRCGRVVTRESPRGMLRNAWTDAWADPDGPGPLGMPLQNILTSEANARIARLEPEGSRVRCRSARSSAA